MKTAVEWLQQEVILQTNLPLNLENVLVFNKLIEQAKEMELSKLVECWNTAHQAGRFEGKGIAEKDWQTFETYWEETFKSE
jgi:hypothetical protein